MKHLLWTLMAILLVTTVNIPQASAESQTFSTRYQTMSNYTYQRNMALQKRVQAQQAGQEGVSRPKRKSSYSSYGSRYNNRAAYGLPIDREMEIERRKQIVAIENAYRARFPLHPGLYRDAYDRGSFGPGKN